MKRVRRDQEVKMLKVKKNWEKIIEVTEVNINEAKWIIRYRGQNAGRSRYIETGNNSFERVEQFKFLGSS